MPATSVARSSLWPGIATLAVSFVLLFFQLGHYSLWDDEALTALVAVGITKTGDTSVEIGHNIIAYRNGMVIRNMRDRSTPPLCEYLAAPSVALFPGNALAARIPFAVLGWLTVLLGVMVLWKLRVSQVVQWIAALAIVGNVSFFLYFRQCRYYGPVIFFSTLVLVLYFSNSMPRRRLLLISLASGLLFVSNYLSYLVLSVCLAADYLLWRRKELALGVKELALLLVPQAIGCALIAMVWNPLNTNYGSYISKSTVWDRVVMFFWTWRDMNTCEFFSGLVFFGAIVLGLLVKDKWLMRGSLAALLYTIALSAVTPQIREITSVADVRYFIALIPIFIAMQIRFLALVATRHAGVAVFVAIIAFGTNLLNGGPLLSRGFHSTIADYLGELANPPPEPYAPAAKWLRENIRPGQSVLVYPDFMNYPLMFHAPQAVYAWQLQKPAPPSLQDLPPIHFKFQEPPDYLVGFGPSTGQMLHDLRNWGQPVQYALVEQLDVLGAAIYRPELFWRTFKPITKFDRSSQAVYIFRRVSPPVQE